MLNYFGVILLIIMIFEFIKDKKLLTVQKIQLNISNLEEKIDSVLKDTDVVYIKSMEDIININKNKCSNLIVLNENIKLTRRIKKILIANYIKEDKSICGFNIYYEFKDKNKSKAFFKNLIDELKILAINYINIFSKENLFSYGIIIGKTKELIRIFNTQNIQSDNKNIVSFIPNEQLKMELAEVTFNTKVFKVKRIDIGLVIKALLLIFAGITITTNITYEIIKFLRDFSFGYQLITSGVIYYCYIYVIGYLYKPIGKYKMIS